MPIRRVPIFDVIAHDAHDQATRCSYCTALGPVVVLPLVGIVGRPELDGDLKNSDGDDLWAGLCEKCVELMRLALVAGEPS